MTMWSMAAVCAAAAKVPTPAGATNRRCWSAISFSHDANGCCRPQHLNGGSVGKVLNLNEQSADPARRVAEEAFGQLQQMVADDMALVNETILDRMKSPVALIPELAGHLIASGGKRLRPILSLATSKLLDYQGLRQTKLAACHQKEASGYMKELIRTNDAALDDAPCQRELRRIL